MPQKLKNFKVRKVSLVGWGANDEPISFNKSASADQPGTEILIFKSVPNINGDDSMVKVRKEDEVPLSEEEKKKKEEEEAKALEGKETKAEEKKEKEEEAAKSATPLSKADIEALIQKAVDAQTVALRKENDALRTEVGIEKGIRRLNELTTIAKSEYPSLGQPDEVAIVLKSIEDAPLSDEIRTAITGMLKKAQAVSKEAERLLFAENGYSSQTVSKFAPPGSPVAEFEAKVQERLAEISKSSGAAQLTLLQKRALAETQVSKEHPNLAKAVMTAQKQESLRNMMGVS